MKSTSIRAIIASLAVSVACAPLLTSPLAAQDTNAVVEPDFEAENDPFIWLEETRSDRALKWVENENEKTVAALQTDPRFEALKAEALAIYDAEDRIPSVSFRHYGLVNFWQDAKNPKGILRRTTLESWRTDNPEWETILDVDALAAAEGKEWVYGGMTCLPPDGTRCMVYLSDGGKDASVAREFDLDTLDFVDGGFELPESQGSASWVDQDTLLVSRDFGDGTVTDSFYPFTTRVWKRGSALEDAPEIFRGEKSDVSAGAYLLRDGEGTIHGRMAYRGVSFHEREYFYEMDGEWVKLDLPAKAGPYGIIDGQILFSTDVDWETQGQTFPADSLVSADLEEWKADPNGAKKTLVWKPADRQTKRGASSTKSSLYVSILDNVRGQVLKFDYVDGAWTSQRIGLPENATVGVATASDETDQIMFTSTDFLSPGTYYYAENGVDLEVVKESPERFAAAGMEIEQFEATSPDGTKIPYFLVKPKGMAMDGSTPVLMGGYGGFQVPRLPSYLGSTGKMWLERGNAYVLANIRGGGEFGPNWHQSAIRENKQRTWDDFIAVGRDLVARGITSPEHLGVEGGSQGGLLVGTAFTQAPDLFNAAIVQIPLFDMLRYQYIGRGASWIGEYGDPRIPEQRAWIEGYSPYQKLLEQKDYPRVFFVTSTADDRTHPSHGRKAAARMAAQGDDYLYYEDTKGGHSGGVDNEQRATLRAMQIVYLLQQLADD
ncbi:prolyl oligopeptidase [Citromicrobium sp. RCC1885]|uniref:prolyl oligopeptidase family serine peptidase n=1 Tax=unclassified Citromicrobium TaxID=2630544 RepID=UPI0006C91B3E|nr:MULTISPECIES: prolyl oligopeptidase family serine peptidase [unclassified Citromicrobium]KPM24710.1 prolyl oligopeptidase [Citromicrobium sp. RCC1885]KPM27953.1 prolyl oligopeptidase [Citromicrobium sp. RCC1878]MAO03475.1 S9 family peptidase [Citromicrobium sp.]OAM10543.1 prolyl oligopeptidase [Citromicrobium sp. RCC1897]|tara:strand:- start:4822 stop:6975 length:2154 start_codon:yes stop_codon:yes gene_type:complete